MEDAKLLTPSEWMCLPCSLVRSHRSLSTFWWTTHCTSITIFLNV